MQCKSCIKSTMNRHLLFLKHTQYTWCKKTEYVLDVTQQWLHLIPWFSENTTIHTHHNNKSNTFQCSTGSLKAWNAGMLQGIKCNALSYFQYSTNMSTKCYLLDIKYLQIWLIIAGGGEERNKKFQHFFQYIILTCLGVLRERVPRMALAINRSSIPTSSPTLCMADGSCSHRFNTCKYELYKNTVAI